MPVDLILKPSCSGCGCGSTVELYASTCKHLTLCEKCGKSMAQNRSMCCECSIPITHLIQEYNVRACSSSDKSYFIGKFTSGLPNFEKTNENKWLQQKEGLQGRQVTDALRTKHKNTAWHLEDETGQFKYIGNPEGSNSASYYLLMLQEKEFVSIPARSWYNFNKQAKYKTLSLEEAEKKMKHRRKTADGYERWMMKVARNGAAAFGEVEKPDDRGGAAGGGRGRRKTSGDDDEADVSDNGEQDEEEPARKNRLGLIKKSGDDDDEEGPKAGDFDLDDDDIEKGDDWEHEEIFSDDDEAVGNDSEEREDLPLEIPAPPEIKQDEDEGAEEEGGLSKSGKELKQLLRRANGLNDSDAEADDEYDTEDDTSPVLAPKKEAPKKEPVNISPIKSTTSAAGRGTPKPSKAKRKCEESNTPNGAPVKKVKTDEVKSASSFKSNAPIKGASPPASSKSGPVSEDEIRAVLSQKTPLTTHDLVEKFNSRLKVKEDRNSFAAILRRIVRIQKAGGGNFVVLRES